MPRFSVASALGLAIAAAFGAVAQPATAQSGSDVFTFQARITANGNPLSGQHTLTFALYENSGPTDSEPVHWSETEVVTVTDGYICAVLGDGTSLTGKFTGAERYVGVHLGSDTTSPELVSPRVRITAVPYALNAAGSGTVLPSTNGGRLSLSSTESAPTSATGDTVYLHRHSGSRVSLYYSGAWRSFDIPETPASLVVSGASSGLYDIYAVPTSETSFTLQISSSEWLDSTKRNSAEDQLEQLDGIWVLNEAGPPSTRKRYLGTIHWTGSTINDTTTSRDLWNVDNQVQRFLYTAASSTTSSAGSTYVEVSTSVRVYYVLGLTAPVKMYGSYQSWTSSGFQSGWINIGVADDTVGTMTVPTTYVDGITFDSDLAVGGTAGSCSMCSGYKVTKGRFFSTVLAGSSGTVQLSSAYIRLSILN